MNMCKYSKSFFECLNQVNNRKPIICKIELSFLVLFFRGADHDTCDWSGTYM